MGIYDRDYMHRQPEKNQLTGRQAMFALIVINAVCFLFIPEPSKLYYTMALSVGDGIGIDTIWQLFTAGFIHNGFWHMLFNMWGLYIFGALIAPHISGKNFIILYLAGAASGNLLFLLCNLITPIPTYLVGASGAVCAIMAAAATLEPERRFVMLFLPFTPIKTTTLVICYTIMEILSILGNNNSNIAHLAHLGGFAGGYITMKILFGNRLTWDPLRNLFAAPRRYQQQTPQNPQHQEKFSGNAADAKVTQRELDALLDKLSTSGINSLSEYELARLRKARLQMRGEDK